MLRRLALAALLASAANAATPSNVSSAVEWGDCAFVATALAKSSQFDCATLRVPFCHESAPCRIDATHALSLLRRRSNTDPSAPTVWLVADAAETRTIADLMERIASLAGKGTVNVYSLQMRLWNPPAGPGDSFHFQPCLSLLEGFGARAMIDSSTLDAAAACKEWVAQNLGDDGILGYSLTNAASDLDMGIRLVQSQELVSNPNLYLMSVGKASRVVQRYMALNAETKTGVAGFVFDTPHPMKFSPSQDEINGEATSLYLSGCESDELCRTKYGNASTSMNELLQQMYTAVDSSSASISDCVRILKDPAFDDVRDLKPSHGLRRFFASWRKDSDKATLVPPILYRMHRCNTEDAGIIQSIASNRRRLELSSRQTSKISQFIERVISYSEIWPKGVMARQELVKAFEGSLVAEGTLLLQQPSACVYRASNASDCLALYRRTPEANSTFPLTYTAPSIVTSSAVDATTGLIALKSTDVLIVTSRLSTEGSAKVTRQLYDAFTSKRGSEQVVTLIESNNLESNEVNGGSGDTILKLVGRFVSKKGKGWSGLRHINDFSEVDWTCDSIELSQSTYGSAPVVVDFKVTTTRRRWNVGLDFWRDPYDLSSSLSWPTYDTSSSSDKGKIATYVVLGSVGLGLVLGLVWRQFHARAAERDGRPPATMDNHAMQTAPFGPQPPHGYHPQHPGPSRPFNWVEQPVNSYAASYTPAGPNRFSSPPNYRP